MNRVSSLAIVGGTMFVLLLSFQNFSSEDLNGKWQLIHNSVLTPAANTFPCQNGYNGCTSSGLPKGTYTIASASVAVNKGDVLVLRGQVSGDNNASNSITRFDAWIDCDKTLASPVMSKDLAHEYQSKYRPNLIGNHHAGIWVSTVCEAKSAGTMQVAMMGRSAANGMTFENGSGSSLFVQQFRSTAQQAGLGVSEFYSANENDDVIPMTVEEQQYTSLQKTGLSISAGDSVFINAQAAAAFSGPGDSQDKMFGMTGTGLQHAGCENAMPDLPFVSTNEWGLIKGTPSLTSIQTQGRMQFIGDSATLSLDNSHALLQALVFNSSGSFNLTSADVQPISRDVALTSGNYVDVGRTEIQVSKRALVDVIAHAQVNSQIGNVDSSAQCYLISAVYNHSTTTMVANSRSHKRSFSYPFSNHPLMNEYIFNLPQGSYDVVTRMHCNGSFGASDLEMAAAGSGVTTIIYEN